MAGCQRFQYRLNSVRQDGCHNCSGAEGSTSVGRMHEKEELQSLNDRLSHYIRHVQELRSAGDQGFSQTSVTFFQSIEALEKELVDLKELYEGQLQIARSVAYTSVWHLCEVFVYIFK